MKPSSWDKQLGLASPLKCAAIQSGQTNNPSRNETGLDASHHIHVSPEGRGEDLFLDILIGLLTHYKARTEALCESIEKSPIDVNGSKARGTFVAQVRWDRLAVQR
jgi:hypothetical protein